MHHIMSMIIHGSMEDLMTRHVNGTIGLIVTPASITCITWVIMIMVVLANVMVMIIIEVLHISMFTNPRTPHPLIHPLRTQLRPIIQRFK